MIMRGMALVATVVMIGAEGPASAQTRAPGSDALRQQIERRFDEVVVVPPGRGDAIHGAEVIRVLVSARYADMKSLQKPLV